MSPGTHNFDEEDDCNDMMMTVQSSLKWRAALLRGRKRRSRPSLTDEDVSFLTTNTLFSEVDIRSSPQCGDGVMPKLMSMICCVCSNFREWWREFIMDCPDGMLTKEKVLEMLTFILPRSK